MTTVGTGMIYSHYFTDYRNKRSFLFTQCGSLRIILRKKKAIMVVEFATRHSRIVTGSEASLGKMYFTKCCIEACIDF